MALTVEDRLEIRDERTRGRHERRGLGGPAGAERARGRGKVLKKEASG
jgi:hypothetical protein